MRLAVLLLGATLAGLVLIRAVVAPAAVPDDLQVLREAALEAVNQSRSEHGLAPVETAEPLAEAAQAHAEDMLERDYYSHASPEGGTVRDRYLEHGGSEWHLVEENIARCTNCPVPPDRARIEALQRGWMDSPGHRANILAHGIESFGFGIAFDQAGTLYAVQTFAGPGTSSRDGGTADAAPLAPDRRLAALVDTVNEARAGRKLDPIEASDALSTVAEATAGRSDGSAPPAASAGLFDALPASHRRDWQRLQVLSATCGGCGVEITAADIDRFARQWLDDPKMSAALLAPDTTALGATFTAAGNGKKTAVAVVGQR